MNVRVQTSGADASLVSNHNAKKNLFLLMQVVLQMRDQYNDLLANKWRPKFDQLSRSDNYTPLYILTPQEYTENIGNFPHDHFDEDVFPKHYPFSSFVPNTYDEIKKFIHASMRCVSLLDCL